MGNSQSVTPSQIKHFGLAGYPIEGSLSPLLFSSAYPGQPFSYGLFPARSAYEAQTIRGTLNLTGVNITAPLKELAIKLVDEISPEAEAVQAINTVVWLDQKRRLEKGYNTDIEGVLESFKEFNIELQGKTALVIGAGGAGRAAAYALLLAGANVTIINRTLKNARTAATLLNCKASDMNYLQQEVEQSEVIINTLTPDIDIVQADWLNVEKIILDASYRGSSLLNKAKNVGCTCIDGRYWLLYQGIEAYRLFTGIEPNVEAMRKTLQL